MSGEAEGVTLLEAINAGRVPTPGELSFPQWQAWRRDEGTSSYSREGWKKHLDARRSGPLERGHGRPLWRREGRRVGFGG